MLREILPAAETLGLDVAPARAVLREIEERLGLSMSVYVLALVGGTGVGKSTIVNALAGQTVSAAGVRRPTTAAAMAWIPGGGTDGLRPLLARLGASIAEAPADRRSGLRSVVVLDLPDLDSIETSHRAAVEEVLPHVDVVAWVTDPEKYADALLHDGFLRRWLPRLDRQIVVLNKTDRLPAPAIPQVTADLESRLAAEVPRRRGVPTVIAISAADGARGIAPLRDWIEAEADAKLVVARRLETAARAEIADLATLAGVVDGFRPLVPPDDRFRTVDRATQEALRVIDPAGAESRAVAATRTAARRRGTGPIGLLTAGALRLFERGGSPTRPIDYLASWRNRGSLTPAAEAVRGTVVAALGQLPAGQRAGYALALGADVERRLGSAVDVAVGRQQDLDRPPASRWWPLLGVLQTANQLVVALVAAWLVIWFVLRPQLPDVVLPVIGAIPAPLVLLAVSIVLGYLLARLLAVHAGWLGRRWAARLVASLRQALAAAIADEAFASIDRLDAARQAIAVAWATVRA